MDKPDFYKLLADSLPLRYRQLVSEGTFEFRAITKDELLKGFPDLLTRLGWKGISLTAPHDDLAHYHLGAKMLLAIDPKISGNKGENIVAYLRWEFGYINFAEGSGAIVPAALSHMTSVHPNVRDSGLGTVMKYFLFQVAHEVSNGVVNDFTWTFDPMQGRNAKVNFNHLGAICGSAGGLFEEDAYGETGAEQHTGNPTDRFHVVLNRRSVWSRAHFDASVIHPNPEQVRRFPQLIETSHWKKGDFETTVPTHTNLTYYDDFLAAAIPFNWDDLLKNDNKTGCELAIKWRKAFREVCHSYMRRGYTFINCVSDKDLKINYLILARDFNPNQPPTKLLKGI